jgi:preprotein translocase SecE subunit
MASNRPRNNEDDDPLRREDLPGELEDQALAGGAAARVPADERSGPRPGGNRALNFLRASWAELQRVQWPDRRQVTQATAVVLGFVAIAGAYLGAADWAAQRVVDFII